MRSHGVGELADTPEGSVSLTGATGSDARLAAASLRGASRVPLSSTHEGRFGRMFRRLSPMPPLPEEVLRDLAATMSDDDPPTGWGGVPAPRDNAAIPAGYTYLGQFVDHDITFDPTSSLQRQNDPDALHDFRTPKFDLDSLYGSGPADEPFQYVKGTHGLRFLIDQHDDADDLPRNSEGIALIGDPRNDENTIISQMQLLFLRLHNRIGEQVLADDTVPAESKFQEAQQRLRWHYQWVVACDFVPRAIGTELHEQLFDTTGELPQVRTRFYKPRTKPYMPVEFSAAAFRYGHSQIRGVYDLNSVATERPIFTPGELLDPTQDLRGFRPLTPQWTIDWSLFFPLPGATPQLSRLIDTRLVPALSTLPGGGRPLALRNLLRGQVLGLPSGQDVARYLGVERVLGGGELEAPEPTPLWFYVLKESEIVTGGVYLGPVGGRIVGEVLLGMLEGDPQSWYSVNRGWRPTLSQVGEHFTMADLVAAAQ